MAPMLLPKMVDALLTVSFRSLAALMVPPMMEMAPCAA
jgi:hypothetical protein